MKKLVLLVALIVGVSAHAGYLFWMVNDNPMSGTDISGSSTTFTWDTAKLVMNGTAVAELTSTDATKYKSYNSYALASVGDSWSSATFFIELYNEDTWLAKSTEVRGSNLAQYITDSNSMTPVSGVGWTGSSYAVPEPTSGLLFLVGGMLLGLRRRRMA